MEYRELNNDEKNAWQEQKQILDDIYLADELYWKQRARDKWLKEGDLNTAFFHKCASHRKKKNLIFKMEINGVITDSFEDIQIHIEQFYQQLFGVESIKQASLENNFWDARFLNIRLDNIKVLDEARHPHMVRLKHTGTVIMLLH